MKLVIRKKDNYNFILADKLDKPKIYTMAGKDIISNYDNQDYFYGTIHGAIYGLLKHSKKNKGISLEDIPNELAKIKPNSEDINYNQYLDIDADSMLAILELSN
jgi:hypothetical protein